jgi:hypothetical protein
MGRSGRARPTWCRDGAKAPRGSKSPREAPRSGAPRRGDRAYRGCSPARLIRLLPGRDPEASTRTGCSAWSGPKAPWPRLSPAFSRTPSGGPRGVGGRPLCGLRLGELQAFACQTSTSSGVSSASSEAGTSRSRRSSRRAIPAAARSADKPLRGHLAAHSLRRVDDAETLVFGRANGMAFSSEALTKRARSVWARADIASIGLHECRRTYAAFMPRRQRHRASDLLRTRAPR